MFNHTVVKIFKLCAVSTSFLVFTIPSEFVYLLSCHVIYGLLSPVEAFIANSINYIKQLSFYQFYLYCTCFIILFIQYPFNLNNAFYFLYASMIYNLKSNKAYFDSFDCQADLFVPKARSGP